MIVGAVLAGGQSRRFGSDKAAAVFAGRTLLDHVVDALRPQVDALLICGRALPGFACVPDRPRAGLGPLGGLNAALHWAAANGFDRVASAPCDAPGLPPDLVARLAACGAPARLGGAPVVGLWPVTAAAALDDWIAGPDRSLRGWGEKIGATVLAGAVGNVNTPADLAALSGSDCG